MKENELRRKFVGFVEHKGFRLLNEFDNMPPDLIISDENGKRIAVELKALQRSSGSRSFFPTALGQLLFSKIDHNADDLWLVMSKKPSILSLKWIKLFRNHGIKVLALSNNDLIEVSEDSMTFPDQRSEEDVSIDIEKLKEKLPPDKRRIWHVFFRSLRTDTRIFNLLKEHPEGLKIGEIANILDMHREVVDSHVRNPNTGPSDEFSPLKNKILIEDKKVKLIDQ